jgi:NAD(P)-dependent dehydrogenase (short-subunit alcohol dehydrogenase family)
VAAGWLGPGLVGVGDRRRGGGGLFGSWSTSTADSTPSSTWPASPGQTFFAQGTEEDWLAVLAVHLGGYLNVLDAALPLMAAAGHGHVLGVTSGSGWRAADAGAYSCAKRAVAALTWQLGRRRRRGVTVNAMSPIAATRMVAAALERARQAGRTSGGGGSPSLDGRPRGPRAARRLPRR